MELQSSTSLLLHHQQQEQQQQQMMIPLIKTTHDDDDDEQQVASKSNKLEDTKKEEEEEKEEEDDGLLMVVRKEERFKYKECMRNHAASIGGNARDGCGEFMPQQHGRDEDDDDDDVTSNESMYCSVCSCHRNFHRKELLVQNPNNNINNMIIRSRNMNNLGYPTMGHHHHPMIMSYNHQNPIIMASHQHDDHGHDGDGMNMMMMMGRGGLNNNNGNGNGNKKRRFRTKFSKEQREKMVGFAERVGWKIQKQEESVVQRFCEEIGVKKRVLKVWMHNNKHTLANKIPLPSSTA